MPPENGLIGNIEFFTNGSKRQIRLKTSQNNFFISFRVQTLSGHTDPLGRGEPQPIRFNN